MRPIYFCLKLILIFGTRIFFKKVSLSNAPKRFRNRTIYVSNHAAAFLDPLLVASRSIPLYFFMTRSDVFKKSTRLFMSSAHMLPIYRQQDGVDTVKENEIVFNNCAGILRSGRNLLLFGEGFTDDVFIRRLKPVKKGAVRIGFHSLEAMNWQEKVYLAAIGCNYTDPDLLRGEAVLSFSQQICLNDYKDEYIENPNKVINDVSKILEIMMQDQITHVQKTDLAPFHENMMILTQKGMNAQSYNPSLTLIKRWKYSKSLAKWLNEQEFEKNEELKKLKLDTELYFEQLKKIKVEDQHVFWKQQNGNRLFDLMKLILLFPLTLIGAIHLLIPYLLIKRFVEKTFKRKVFWSSVKFVIGIFVMGLINLPYIYLFHKFIYPNWWLSIVYFFLIPVFGIVSHTWMKVLKEFKAKGLVNKTNLTDIIKQRGELINQIESITSID